MVPDTLVSSLFAYMVILYCLIGPRLGMRTIAAAVYGEFLNALYYLIESKLI